MRKRVMQRGVGLLRWGMKTTRTMRTTRTKCERGKEATPGFGIWQGKHTEVSKARRLIMQIGLLGLGPINLAGLGVPHGLGTLSAFADQIKRIEGYLPPGTPGYPNGSLADTPLSV